MTVFAPRIAPALVEALVELDDRDLPIAEINRRLGEHAESLGLRRPSYQRVRELVHELRAWRPPRRGPTTRQVLLDIISRARPPDAFGSPVPRGRDRLECNIGIAGPRVTAAIARERARI